MTCDMAIPFNLPSDEQTEENNRRLDQLLLDLYSVLRQILLRPTNDSVNAAAMPSRREEPAPVPAAPSRSGPVAEGDATRSRRPVLPDVVASAVCQCQCARRAQPQRRHRRRRRPSCCHAEQPVILPVAPAPAPADNWLVLGLQLRKIAEELKISFAKQEVSREREREESVKMEVKTSSLFSLLVPTHLRGSIWTTVILLVGWRLLVRTR